MRPQKPADFDYIETLPVKEKEAQYKKMQRYLPDAILKWNQQFMGLINDFVNKKTPYDETSAAAVAAIWHKRKQLEADTNCHPFWVFRKHNFLQTFRGLDWDFAEMVEGEL